MYLSLGSGEGMLRFGGSLDPPIFFSLYNKVCAIKIGDLS